MRTFLRTSKIIKAIAYFGLEDFLIESKQFSKFHPILMRFIKKIKHYRSSSLHHLPKEIRLVNALESLGPLFVKLGQLLSTRRDLLETDVADALARLQDQVEPFPFKDVEKILLEVYKTPIHDVFESFDETPIASASVAQVHFAVLKNGQEVAVKVLRPNIDIIIKDDLNLLKQIASFLERFFHDAKRLRLSEVIEELEKSLNNELDLLQEASNASQLRRNFEGSHLLVIPEIYWDFSDTKVLVMQRVSGIPVSQIDRMIQSAINTKQLARDGVEIFFTQVFRDGFFHADMHPGNIFVNEKGQYVAVDFGIVGTLTDQDKSYLAHNFLAFFKRDYKKVAQAHVDAGWVPKETRVDEFESAIRAVCDPIFDKPLKDISLGKLLLRLFQTSRKFNVYIQPQLVLLQKTMLNIEGLGRELDPDLDLWKTAKPYLERWMSEQVGWRSFTKSMKEEMPYWGHSLPQIPRMLHDVLQQSHQLKLEQDQHLKKVENQKKYIRSLWIIIFILISFIFFKIK